MAEPKMTAAVVVKTSPEFETISPALAATGCRAGTSVAQSDHLAH
jgi:hypothetical protein